MARKTTDDVCIELTFLLDRFYKKRFRIKKSKEQNSLGIHGSR